MRFAFYCAVLLVAASGVLFGLDWTSAPMPPMPESKNIVFVPPPPPPQAVVTPVAPPAPSPPPAAIPPAAPVAEAPHTLPQTPAPDVAAASPPAAPKLRCDVEACASAYRSFRESDCTYNPSVGPRRLCTKGDPTKYANEPPAAPPAVSPGDAAEPIVAPKSAEPSAPRCDVSACTAAYNSFMPADCTYQPSNGPRRLCTKGDPTKYANEPPAAPPAVSPGDAAEPIVAPEPAESAAPRCNVSACAAAYVSFTPADCTYQPSSGPRRLCTK